LRWIGIVSVLVDRAALVDRVAQHVHDAAQRGLAHRHRDAGAGVADHQAAAQAVGRAQRDGAHDAVAQLLLHFQRQRRAFELERVVDAGHASRGNSTSTTAPMHWTILPCA
jgi:hypothetical protein